MAEQQDDSQEKSQEATPKRKQELRSEGNVPRSRELNRVVILLGGGAVLWLNGKQVYASFQQVSQSLFTFTREDIFNSSLLWTKLIDALASMMLSLLPFFIIIYLFVLLTPILMGGWAFSSKALIPKIDRLSPLKGIKRIVSLKSFVELLKALGKFIVILGAGILVLWWKFDTILFFGTIPVQRAIIESISLLALGFLIIASVLIIIAAIDVPFQYWEYLRKAKMTQKEVKDENKETEGSPELKQRIRSAQQAIAQRRMIQEVPEASVVITNPTHYAIALKYDQDKELAPILVAKGVDHFATRIIEVAKEHRVTLYSAPPLARAIYYNTDIGQEIPHGLYISVAKVLAYIYQLKQFDAGFGVRPPDLKEADFPIPDELKHD